MTKNYALITGGTSGIGFEIAKSMAINNLNLVLVYLHDEEKAKNALTELQKINPNIGVKILKWDLSQISTLNDFWIKVKSFFLDFKISHFISCHGRIGSNLFLFKKQEEIANTINEHLVSNVLLTHLILKDMCVAKFGRILFLTSLASKKINRGQSDYALSKSALEVFVKSMTAEHFHRGVTFNCISAGLVNTRVTEEISKAFADKSAEGAKIVDVKNVARMAMLILSDESSDISGSTFSIDGGQGSIGNNHDYHRLSFKAEKS